MLKLVFHNSNNWFLFLALQRPYLICFSWKECIVSLRFKLFKIVGVILILFLIREVCSWRVNIIESKKSSFLLLENQILFFFPPTRVYFLNNCPRASVKVPVLHFWPTVVNSLTSLRRQPDEWCIFWRSNDVFLFLHSPFEIKDSILF